MLRLRAILSYSTAVQTIFELLPSLFTIPLPDPLRQSVMTYIRDL